MHKIDRERQCSGSVFPSATKHPAAPENILSRNGRGIYLMQELMDEVHFEEGGTLVKICKKRNVGTTTAKKSELEI
jgi:anti-sigma regulatory factor (Ser/Thr protein kinase)